MKGFSKELFCNLTQSPNHQVLASHKVVAYMGEDKEKHIEVGKLLKRYFSCDWGEDILNDEEDSAVNNSALSYGGRILGVYYIDNIKLFIMTSSYWRTTEIMFADEY